MVINRPWTMQAVAPCQPSASLSGKWPSKRPTDLSPQPRAPWPHRHCSCSCTLRDSPPQRSRTPECPKPEPVGATLTPTPKPDPVPNPAVLHTLHTWRTLHEARPCPEPRRAGVSQDARVCGADHRGVRLHRRDGPPHHERHPQPRHVTAARNVGNVGNGSSRGTRHPTIKGTPSRAT